MTTMITMNRVEVLEIRCRVFLEALKRIGFEIVETWVDEAGSQVYILTLGITSIGIIET